MNTPSSFGKARGAVSLTYDDSMDCHLDLVGPDEAQVSLDPFMLKHFIAARGTCRAPDYSIEPLTADLSYLGTISGDNMTLEQWLAAVDRAVELGHWVIFTFHGVGPEKARLQVPESEHAALLRHMAAFGEKLWVAPVRDVARAFIPIPLSFD